MIPESDAKVIVVEGPEDGYVLASLCNHLFGRFSVRARGPHPAKPEQGGWSLLLRPEHVKAHILGSGRRAVGFVVDADLEPGERYASFRATLTSLGYVMPPDLDSRGWVGDATGLPRVGIWVAPDNRSNGNLDDLLATAIRTDEQFPNPAELAHCIDALPPTLRRFPDKSRAKALLRTWMAWSTEPDIRTGDALKKHHLVGEVSPNLDPLVAWLRSLYALEA